MKKLVYSLLLASLVFVALPKAQAKVKCKYVNITPNEYRCHVTLKKLKHGKDANKLLKELAQHTIDKQNNFFTVLIESDSTNGGWVRVHMDKKKSEYLTEIADDYDQPIYDAKYLLENN